MMASMDTSKTTMLLVTLVVLVMMGLVDGCERRGEELICQGELPTLDAKQVRDEKKLRENKIFASFETRGYHRALITVH